MRYQALGWLAVFAIPLSAQAQIVPDPTLPNPSIVTPSSNTQIITGGTSAGSNLFHSFSQFSVPLDGIAQFRYDPAIRNLLVRVTGNSPSTINGRLETALTSNPTQRGEANLFLLNPNGITFGERSSLNLGGSFVASTADRIRLSNGSEFSARNPAAPLLTVAVPIGLQFGNNPGAIENQSTTNQVGLLIPSGRTLALLGGNVILSGGILSAGNSKIELAAIDSNGQVSFDLTNSIFNYGNSLFRDVALLNGGLIQLAGSTAANATLTARNITMRSGTNNRRTGIFSTATTTRGLITINAENLFVTGANSRITSSITLPGKGTDVQLQVQNLQLSQGGNITTLTEGGGQGGNLAVTVDSELRADGKDSGLFVNSSGANNGLPATGNSGNLSIKATSLSLSNGAQINSISRRSAGNSGNINLDVSNQITLSGVAQIQNDTVIPTIISTQTFGSGNSGTLNIVTNQLEVAGGAQIVTSTLGSGTAGLLDIRAKEIQVTGVARSSDGRFLVTSDRGVRLSSAITSDAQPGSTGQGADLTINTDRLTISNGGVIQAATFGTGNAGNASITATESILIQGVAPNPDDPFPSSILAFSGGIPNKNVFNVPAATGKGGNIAIVTPNLKLADGALISLGSVNSTSAAQGAGDRLQINADTISLNQAELNAATNAGNGGTFDITANRLLLLRNGSKIITQAGGVNQGGNAGDIRITAPLIIAKSSEDSDINANAAEGNGGNIFITAESVVGIEPRSRLTELSDITASSERGAQGTITLNSPETDPDRGTVPLATTPNDPSNQIDQSCSASNTASSQFTIVGRGGLPATPRSTTVTATAPRLATLPNSPTTSVSPSHSPIVIREAQGMQRSANGRIRFFVSDRALLHESGNGEGQERANFNYHTKPCHETSIPHP